MASYSAYAARASSSSCTATDSTASSRRSSVSSLCPSLCSSDLAAASPFQAWLLTRDATHLIPGRPLAEIEVIFTPLTHYYPALWARAPFAPAVARALLARLRDPGARAAAAAAALRACAQLGKLLWNLSNAAAARLVLALDAIGGRRVVGAQVALQCWANGSCDFYPEVRLELGLEGLSREGWARWWAKREAWVRDHRGSANNWDAAVVKLLRGLAERREGKHAYDDDDEVNIDTPNDVTM